MLTIAKLRNLLVQVKTHITEINYTLVVTSNKEFTEHLKARKKAENTIVFAVAPDHALDGKADATKYGTFMQFLFFDKVAFSNLKHEQKLDVYEKIEGIVKEFIDRILVTKQGNNASEGGFDIECGMFDHFDEESVKIELYWDGAECIGYEVMFYLNSK